MFAGIIAAIVGIVVGALSGSQVSVSGPAAGLAVIVLTAIQGIGTYQAFLVAVVLSGLLQLIFGMLKLGHRRLRAELRDQGHSRVSPF
jgi:MFS superfamily sulfate permease-like transporter